jgi:8-oxo-dGTP diphosphatase
MSPKQYTYTYPRPRVAADAVVFTEKDGQRHVLLIQRKYEPFAGMWALPGGFVEMDETLETAAARELEEETGLHGVALKQFHAFGDPGRDPRDRSISIAYVGEVDWRQHAPRGGDDAAEARWFPLDALPDLAFDHRVIVEYAVRACMENNSA